MWSAECGVRNRSLSDNAFSFNFQLICSAAADAPTSKYPARISTEKELFGQFDVHYIGRRSSRISIDATAHKA